MATVYSGWVAQDDYRVRLDFSVSYPNATQAIVTMTAYIDAQYGSIGGWTVYADLACDGQSRRLSRSGFSAWTLTNMGTVSFTVNRSSSARNIGVSCRIYCPSAGGAYASGATASGTASISGIAYSAPAAPSGCAASRASDSQAKVTWSNGATGTTTPRSAVLVERQTDSGGWSQVASLGASATNWTDNSISADHRYAYRVRSQGAGGYSGYSTSGYIYTTPASPSSVTATKTGAQSVQLEIAGAAAWAESYGVERTTDGSTWQACGTATSFPWVDPSAPAGTVRYRVRAVRGDLASAWAESNSVTTITPPLAPSLSGMPAVAATGAALTVSWVPNHPDGSEQTAAQVEYQVGSAASVTADVSGAATTYALPSTATASAGTVKVRVRTHGLDPDWGAWSAYSTVAVAVPPSAHFTNPAVDGATVAALPLAVAWEAVDATGISSQTLQLLGADGSVLLTRQLAGDARSLRIDDSVYALSNLTGYTLRLAVLGGSSLSATTQRSFSTDWAQPSDPGADVRIDPADLSCAVTVRAGDASGAAGTVAEIPAGKTAGGAVVYGSTRQNLWVNPSGTGNGMTVKANADGSLTVSGTATGTAIIQVTSYILRPGGTYTLSIDKNVSDVDLCGASVEWYKDGVPVSNIIAGFDNILSRTFTVPDDTDYCMMRFRVASGTTVSGTYRVMLNEGSEAEPWCPPGLNGVDELSLVCAGKNLLARMGPSLPYTRAGITFSDNGDGGIRVSGTATAAAYYNFFSDSPAQALRITPGEYTASLIGESSGLNLSVEYYDGEIGGSRTSWLMTNVHSVSNTGSIDRPVYLRPFLSVAKGKTVDTVVYPQLELGSTATAYEPPAVTTTPVDLDGHTLNSLPDGTRDELRIEPDGTAVITKRVGAFTLTDSTGFTYAGSSSSFYRSGFPGDGLVESGATNRLCDLLPVVGGNAAGSVNAIQVNELFNMSGQSVRIKRSGLTTADELASWLAGEPLTVLYPLANPYEVELPPVAMAARGAGWMWADAPVPAEVEPLYMRGMSFSVVRVLADGSQWMVADGLTDGQQCIDPLPPLNVDYSYLVTAYAETGVSSSLTAPARVDAALAAFNFGDAAATCELARLDPSWSHSPKRSGTLYHFADGGEAGGLPVPYGGADVDSTRSMGFTVLDPGQLRRLQELAARYYTCWFRDVYGGRALCAVAWSFSSGIPYGKVEVSADMTEAVFEEAW